MSGIVDAAAMLAASATSLPSIRYRTDDLSYDLGLLAAFDAQPVDAAQLERDAEAYLLRTTTERTQLLMKHIFELPVEMDDAGPVAMLPPRSTKLPAAAPPPKPKPLTRWEKFALEKGITKTKRSQKVWDETAGDWKARHGYNRVGEGDMRDWAVPVKEGADPFENPWEKKGLEKKERVVRNKLAQAHNASRAAAAGPGGGSGGLEVPGASLLRQLVVDPRAASAPAARSGSSLVAPRILAAELKPRKRARVGSPGAGASDAEPRAFSAPAALGGGSGSAEVAIPAGIPRVRIAEGRADALPGQGRAPRTKGPPEPKAARAERLRAVQGSTASMGRFDDMRRGEPVRKGDPRRAVRLPNETPAPSEQRRQLDILRKVMAGGGGAEGERAAAGGVSSKGAAAAEAYTAGKAAKLRGPPTAGSGASSGGGGKRKSSSSSGGGFKGAKDGFRGGKGGPSYTKAKKQAGAGGGGKKGGAAAGQKRKRE